MALTHWYAVSVAIAFALLLIHRIVIVISAFVIARFQFLALKHIVYPLFIQRRYWAGVTRLHGALIGSYIIINGFCMGLGIHNMSDLIIRSGTMASINIVPLFLGGRTNILANFMGISLHTYYLAHHWIGRVVIAQSLVHVALVIAVGKPWTFDSSQISGISSASALALILLLSIYFVRRMMYELFLKVHILLAFIAIFALLIHVSPGKLSASIFPTIALSLWGLNTVLRLSRTAYYNLGGRRTHTMGQASVTHFFDGPDEEVVSAVKLTVRLRRPLKIHPGQYFYLFLSDMGLRRRFQAHPYVITWWDDSLHAMNISFLIQPHSGISSDLIARNSLRSVTVDGPYGKDLKLENYETVILIAKGIGIAGLLPYARHMTYRRVSKDKDHEAYRRGLITRKIDIFWIMDDNCQQDWLSAWISELQNRDSDKLILTFSCFYPHKQTQPPPVPADLHWRFVYQQDALPIIEGLVIKQIQRSPGRTKVAACGNPEFSSSIRAMVLKAMGEYQDVEFAEAEFQPRGVRQAYPGIHRVSKGDIEMTARSILRHGERKRHLVTSSRLGQPQVSFRSGSTGAAISEVQGLIRSHSGVSTQLKTLEEKDEPVETVGSQAKAKEIV